MAEFAREKMKALIFGSGSVGQRHAKNLNSFRLSEIAWGSLDEKRKSDHKDGSIRFYSLEDSLKYGPDVVFVCNPTSLHAQTASFFLKEKIPIYLEKPVSSNLDDAEKLYHLWKEKQKPTLFIGYQYRFHSTLLKAKEILSSGELGEILAVNAEVGEWLPSFHPDEDYRTSYASREELGGGVIFTLSHEMDYLFWLFGKMHTVYCVGGKRSDLEISVEDTAWITLTTAFGAPIHLRMNYWRKPTQRKCEIFGTKGSLFWNYDGNLVWTRGKDSSETVFSLPKGWNRNEMFLGSMKSFLGSVEHGLPSAISMEDGFEVMKLLCAAKTSMEIGQSVQV